MPTSTTKSSSLAEARRSAASVHATSSRTHHHKDFPGFPFSRFSTLFHLFIWFYVLRRRRDDDDASAAAGAADLDFK